MSKSQYSDEFRAKIAKLWTSGITCSQIGNQLGMKKNAVIGVVHRMKLPGRASPIKKGFVKAKVTVKVIRETPKIHGFSMRFAANLITATPVYLTGRLRPCAWPLGDPRAADFRFCGDPSLKGRPYCEIHTHVSRHGWMNAPAAAHQESIWNKARDLRLLDMTRQAMPNWKIMEAMNQLPGRRIESLDIINVRVIQLNEKQDKAA
ncbi:MAG: GcrA family cell cycle regulator [Acidocella sp.]|nr:GcrA family cell cycle regulator [Acidocella sp.]